MKIAVVAANGRSGSIFVKYALSAGHQVRAGVYQNNTLTSHPNLVVVTCDATNKDDIDKLINDQDAVVSFIGHVKGSPAHVQTDAIKVISEVMSQKRITRFVSLTGTGVRFFGDNISIIDQILNAGIKIVDQARIQDGKDHVELLKKTNLDWTVIRVLKLQNTQPKGFKLTTHGPSKLVVSREEVAKAVLEVLRDHSFIRQTPIISEPKD